MKNTALAVAVMAMLGLSACSTSPKPGMAPPQDAKIAVKDRTVAAHFRDRGIEVHYTTLGNFEKIYVWGMAPAWKGMDQARILAELDAKAKLIKFVHGEQGESTQRSKLIARSLDKARDNTLNRFDSNTSQEADFSFDATQIEAEIQREPVQATEDNTSRRIAETIDRTMVDQTQTLQSAGRLTGVIKVDDGRSKDGKIYFAKYEWSPKTQSISRQLREQMQ